MAVRMTLSLLQRSPSSTSHHPLCHVTPFPHKRFLTPSQGSQNDQLKLRSMLAKKKTITMTHDASGNYTSEKNGNFGLLVCGSSHTGLSFEHSLVTDYLLIPVVI
mgnify:CR=1 FL=1